jgi:hypothetical protein
VLRYRNFLGVRRPSDIFLSLESGDHGDRESPCSARIATDDELDVH